MKEEVVAIEIAIDAGPTQKEIQNAYNMLPESSILLFSGLYKAETSDDPVGAVTFGFQIDTRYEEKFWPVYYFVLSGYITFNRLDYQFVQFTYNAQNKLGSLSIP